MSGCRELGFAQFQMSLSSFVELLQTAAAGRITLVNNFSIVNANSVGHPKLP